MNDPFISEYIESIRSAEDNFEELSYLKPVLGEDGQPIATLLWPSRFEKYIQNSKVD